MGMLGAGWAPQALPKAAKETAELQARVVSLLAIPLLARRVGSQLAIPLLARMVGTQLVIPLLARMGGEGST
jgi:hypothetical protein